MIKTGLYVFCVVSIFYKVVCVYQDVTEHICGKFITELITQIQNNRIQMLNSRLNLIDW